MAQSHDAPLTTPLADRHAALGARIVEFAGWLMPLQYSGILEEHRAVRARAGLFDLSHMGELFVEGPEAAAGLGYALTTDPASLKVGRAHYSMICFPEGGILDDLIVYRLGDERFMVVANASNAGRRERRPGRAAGRAVGPCWTTARWPPRWWPSRGRARPGSWRRSPTWPWTGCATTPSPRARWPASRRWWPAPDTRARTASRSSSTSPPPATVWDALMEAGKAEGVVPVGLGARDTLRLEAGMPLYGNELGPDTTPFEAGLGRVVNFAKEGDFVGRAALEKARAEGPRKKLVGLTVRGRGIARHGYEVFAGDRRTGTVTSGTLSPTLGEPIAMAYVTPSEAEPGTIVERRHSRSASPGRGRAAALLPKAGLGGCQARGRTG